MATRYRKVDPRMWGDAKFRALSDDARMVFMYLLTAPEVTALPGFVVIGRAGLAEGIGWDEDLERLSRAFAELSAAGMAKADWRARLVILPNAPRYNEPESPNAIRSWRSHFDALPESPLRNEMLGLLRAFTEGLRPNLRETFADTFRLDERAPAEPLVEGSARVPEGLPKGSPEPLVEGSASPPEAPLSRVRATRDARVPAPAPAPAPIKKTVVVEEVATPLARTHAQARATAAAAAVNCVVVECEHPKAQPAIAEMLGKIRELWNEKCAPFGIAELAETKRWPDSRIKNAIRFWETQIDCDIGKWEQIIDHLLTKPLMIGKTKPKDGFDEPWTMNFDWVIHPENTIKVREYY